MKDLKPTTKALLFYIKSEGPVESNPTRMAEALGFDAGNTIKAIEVLIEEGLVFMSGSAKPYCYTYSTEFLMPELPGERPLSYKRTNDNPLYVVWYNMIARCHKPSSTGYKWYGARGIKVCDRWHDFERFVDDVGPRPEGLTLDRIDNDGDYAPGNVKWSSKIEQARNKRDTVHLTIDGETKPLAEWAEETGVHRATLRTRHKAGYEGEDLISPDHATARLFTYKGKTQSIRAWERELGFKKDTLWSRIHRRGLSFKEAVAFKPGISKEVIDQVKALLSEGDMTQVQIAEVVGISSTSVCKINRGHYDDKWS